MQFVIRMSDKNITQNLQGQINRVEQIVNQYPFIIFIMGVVGGMAVSILNFIGYPWSVLGLIIFGVCGGLSVFFWSQAKDEYKKLLDQLNKQ